MIKYVRPSPKKHQQREESPKKKFSVETAYVKKILGEILTEEHAKLSQVQELVDREEERLNDYIEALGESKAVVRELPDQSQIDDSKDIHYYQNLH